TVRPILLIGRGTFNATNSLPRVRMRLTRVSGVMGPLSPARRQDAEKIRQAERMFLLTSRDAIAYLASGQDIPTKIINRNIEMETESFERLEGLSYGFVV